MWCGRDSREERASVPTDVALEEGCHVALFKANQHHVGAGHLEKNHNYKHKINVSK